MVVRGESTREPRSRLQALAYQLDPHFSNGIRSEGGIPVAFEADLTLLLPLFAPSVMHRSRILDWEINRSPRPAWGSLSLPRSRTYKSFPTITDRRPKQIESKGLSPESSYVIIFVDLLSCISYPLQHAMECVQS